MKCDCGGNTHVVDTRKVGNSVRRWRRCKLCDRKLVSVESFVDAAEVSAPIREPKAPKPKKQKTPVAVKRSPVEVRRALEDRKLRVPSYFIEDDDY